MHRPGKPSRKRQWLYDLNQMAPFSTVRRCPEVINIGLSNSPLKTTVDETQKIDENEVTQPMIDHVDDDPDRLTNKDHLNDSFSSNDESDTESSCSDWETDNESSGDDEMPIRNDNAEYVIDGSVLKQRLYKKCRHRLSTFMHDITLYFKKFKLSKNSLDYLLKLFQKYFPKQNSAPKTKKNFMKIVDYLSPKISTEINYTCQSCKYKFQENSSKSVCKMCESDDIAICLSSDIRTIIRQLFETRNLATILENRSDDHASVDKITDVTESVNYLRIKKQTKYDLNLIHNVDGFPLGNSATMQVWPNFLAISELPPNLRGSYMILTDIWIGNGKPHMNTYLEPWVSHMRDLSLNGVEWMHPKLKEKFTTKVHVIISAVDAHARAPLQNISFCTGSYGCSFCEIEGRSLSKKKIVRDTDDPVLEPSSVLNQSKGSNVRYYPYEMSVNAVPRTTENMLENAAKMIDPNLSSSRNKKVKTEKGVKGYATMSLLPQFDISFGFSPDFLHSALLGVVRRHLNFIFDSKYKKKSFYLAPGYQTLVSEKLKLIRPPNFCTRLPRDLKYLKSWKGSEFMWWILFYSLHCLDEYFPSAHLKHQMLLVRSLHTLMKDEITFQEIDECQTNLKLFCSSYRELYDEKEETFNLHLLLHYADAVKKSGPLWASSTFLFENSNNVLKMSIHGSNNIPQELSNTFKIYSVIDVLKSQSITTSSKEIQAIGNLSCKLKSVSLVPDRIRLMIQNIYDFNSSQFLEYFGKIKVNDFSFTSRRYTKALKTCSYYAAAWKKTAQDIKLLYYIKLEIFATNGTKTIFCGMLLIDRGPAFVNDIHNIEVQHIRHFEESNEMVWGCAEDLWKPLVKLTETKFCIPPKVWSAKL